MPESPDLQLSYSHCIIAARRDVAGALPALTALVAELELDRGRLAAAAADPAALATDAAEALVAAGIPFRDAHEAVAAEVRAGTFEPHPPPARHRAPAGPRPPSRPPASGGTSRAGVLQGPMASPAQTAPGAVLSAATVVLLAFRDGGYHDPGGWRVAIVGLLAAAALAIVMRGGERPTWLQLLAALGLAAVAGWTAVSALWSPDPASSVLEAQRAALYLAAVVAAVAVGGRLLVGTLAGIAVACAYALGQRLLQGPPSPPDPFEGTLLQEPLGYANALGALAAIGLAASIVLVLERRRLPPVAFAGVLLAALALTGSRGGWLAAAVGAAVGLALSARRPRLAAATAVTAGLALALVLALPAGSLADDAAPRLGDRAWYWHVAWQEASAAPIAGRGAGTFELAWLREQPVEVSVVDAHSLYLETFAELGLIGLGLLALALAPALVGAFRGVSAAAAGGYVAFLLHAGIDWDWEMPAVVVAGLFCGAALLRPSTETPGSTDV